MRCQFDIVTVPSLDTAEKPTIVLSYDNKRYLFNCGEATQRALITNQIPLRRINQIFLSRGWESHGGLAGTMLGLTANDTVQQLGVHGPKNLAYYLATLRAGQQRNYRYKEVLQLSIDEYSDENPKPFEDANIFVQPVLAFSSSVDKPVKPTTNGHNQEDLQTVQNIARSVWSGQFLERQDDGSWTPYNDADTDASTSDNLQCHDGKRVTSKHLRSMEDSETRQANKRPRLDPIAKSKFKFSPQQYHAFGKYMSDDLPSSFVPFEAAVSYYIQGQPLIGKFHPLEAKALGIKPGPDFGRLQKGQSVRTASGIVHSHQVMGPSQICPPIVLIDCPDLTFMESLIKQGLWETCKGDKQPSVIVHSCGSDVLHHADYIRFMSSFGSNVKHLISSSEHVKDSVTNRKATDHLHNLQDLSHDIYPVPATSEVSLQLPYSEYGKQAINASLIEAGTRFIPYPYLSMSKEKVVPEQCINEEHQQLLTDFKNQCQLVQSQIVELERTREPFGPGGNIEVLTLGTGSAGPSLYRNVAGTLINVPSEFSVLLDCGEGTTGQLARAYGDKLTDALQSLRLVFISHMHADHHLGLIGLIKAWKESNKANEATLFLICPRKYGRSILEYQRIHSIGVERVSIIDSACFTQDYQEKHGTMKEAFSAQLARLKQALPGLDSLSTVGALHSESAMCLRLNHKDGWSIAYSGDTRPTCAFTALCRDVSCLIHEATFEDDMLDEAVVKKHSTISEALQVAREARARCTILTHFSQRYPKLPVFGHISTDEFSQAGFGLAIDLMRVKLQDVWKLGLHLAPQIKLSAGLARLNIQDNDGETEQITLDQ